jgi:hypothetical protein
MKVIHTCKIKQGQQLSRTKRSEAGHTYNEVVVVVVVVVFIPRFMNKEKQPLFGYVSAGRYSLPITAANFFSG